MADGCHLNSTRMYHCTPCWTMTINIFGLLSGHVGQCDHVWGVRVISTDINTLLIWHAIITSDLQWVMMNGSIMYIRFCSLFIFVCDIILRQTGKKPDAFKITYRTLLEKRFSLDHIEVPWLVSLGENFKVLCRNRFFFFYYPRGLQ